MALREINGGRAIAEILHGKGVSHVFFMDAILRRVLVEIEELGVKRVLAHTEAAAAYMADGYARISGKVGVCMAQSVGAANLAAALQDAYFAQSSVLALTGRQPAALQYRNSYQELPHEPFYAPVTKFHAKVELIEQLPRLLNQAFREATSAPVRPVHLDIAGHTGDVLARQQAQLDMTADAQFSAVPAHRSRPDPAAIAVAASAIAVAERPVIVAGRIAVTSRAGPEILRLAAAIDAPILAAPDAADIVPQTDGRFAGIVGTYGQASANAILAQADLVVFAGSNTGDMDTSAWTNPASGTAMVQIHDDARELGRNYLQTIGLLGDVRETCRCLAEGCAPSVRAPWTEVWSAMALTRAHAYAPVPAADGLLHPSEVCAVISALLPENGIVVADTGFSSQWAVNYIALRRSGQRLIKAAGSLGWGFPAALGAKCAAPDAPVVCFTGDGGFFYHMSELETARRHGLNVTIVVNNNGCLAQGAANIHLAYQGRSGNRDEIFRYRPTNFAAIATEMGCTGVVARTSDEFAFKRALDSDTPFVIDARTSALAAPG